MATIQKRQTKDGRITYRVQVRLKGYETQTATFKLKTDARKWIVQTESAIKGVCHFKKNEAKRHTIDESIQRYIKEVLPRKPKSQETQSRQLSWWSKQIGSYALSDITPALIAEQRDKLIKGITQSSQPRSNATVNRYLAVFSHLFSIAMKEWGWVEDNPSRKVFKLKEPRGRARFLSHNERKRLLQACKESNYDYLFLVVVLCLSTGARKMEILGLNWKDIDLRRGIIILHETKNNERRALSLTGLALELMKSHAKIRQPNTTLVFTNHKGDKPMDIRFPWELALKKSGIKDFRFHDLRHSAASYLAMNGASMAEIAEVLGHKTFQMVKRYANLSGAHTTSVVAKMNSKIFGD